MEDLKVHKSSTPIKVHASTILYKSNHPSLPIRIIKYGKSSSTLKNILYLSHEKIQI